MIIMSSSSWFEQKIVWFIDGVEKATYTKLCEKIQLERFLWVLKLFFSAQIMLKSCKTAMKKRSGIKEASIFEILIITLEIWCQHYLTFVFKLWPCAHSSAVCVCVCSTPL